METYRIILFFMSIFFKCMGLSSPNIPVVEELINQPENYLKIVSDEDKTKNYYYKNLCEIRSHGYTIICNEVTYYKSQEGDKKMIFSNIITIRDQVNKDEIKFRFRYLPESNTWKIVSLMNITQIRKEKHYITPGIDYPLEENSK